MKIILHGGLLDTDEKEKNLKINHSLREIAEKAYHHLTTHTAVETAVYTVTLLEDDPLFNAGTGSQIQVDGKIRMSAAISDGTNLTNSSVTNIMDVKNPILVAEKLMGHADKGLSDTGATDFARQNGFEAYSPETPEKRKEFEEKKEKEKRQGTVGCVALDVKGNIAAATSTGGVGEEFAGRTSDSSTVAGNYANKVCGVSCTGTGEDIVNHAIAVKITTRVLDLFPIDSAFEKTFQEVKLYGGDAGAIGLDRDGALHYAYTKAKVCFASYDGEKLKSFLDDEHP